MGAAVSVLEFKKLKEYYEMELKLEADAGNLKQEEVFQKMKAKYDSITDQSTDYQGPAMKAAKLEAVPVMQVHEVKVGDTIKVFDQGFFVEGLVVESLDQTEDSGTKCVVVEFGEADRHTFPIEDCFLVLANEDK